LSSGGSLWARTELCTWRHAIGRGSVAHKVRKRRFSNVMLSAGDDQRFPAHSCSQFFVSGILPTPIMIAFEKQYVVACGILIS